MKPVFKKFLLIVVLVGAAAGLLFAFLEGRKEAALEAERERPVKAPTRVEVVNDENVVKLDPETLKKSGIVVATLEAISHRPEIRAYGTVLDLQELIDLRNSYAAANAQAQKAQAALDVTRKEYERQKTLRDSNQNVSEKAFQSAEGAFRTEEANANAAQVALDTFGATARQRWGAVLAKWIIEGTPEFERLRAQEELLLQVTAPLNDPAVIASETAAIQDGDARLIPARLVSSAPRTDPKIQGRSFFYVTPSRDTNLLAGMNVVALLPAGEPVQGVTVAASSAVWLQGKAWIYVQRDAGRFVRREVPTSQPVKGGWVAPENFAKDRRFVVSGGQLILSEEFRAQIQVGDEGEKK